MKKMNLHFLKLLFFVIALSFIAPSAAEANGKYRGKSNKSWKHHKKGNTVGAPLDGGLLVLLAGAGAAYFGVRKKKKEA